MKKKIVVFASGEGSTFNAIVESCHKGQTSAEVSALLVDRNCGAQNIAKSSGVPCVVFKPIKGLDGKYWNEKIKFFLKTIDPDLILLLGFLRQIGPEITTYFEGKIYNTHPSLLPKFGGSGMYGLRVHEAVLKSKEPITGITIHEVNKDYDSGRIISQLKLSVEPSSTAEELQRRIKEKEKGFLVETLTKLLK